ncbi:hypothetical protein AZH43_02645 [Acinetobacter pragensis]|uniref:Uncharacterized protein n=1 Tax=Acinetobacter pragensis TaxID=1806892 RepID=A0A151XYZ8_9GAMM|nr:hypothetical protein AZH43_02645 [Acinetobacter pragensis]
MSFVHVPKHAPTIASFHCGVEQLKPLKRHHQNIIQRKCIGCAVFPYLFYGLIHIGVIFT